MKKVFVIKDVEEEVDRYVYRDAAYKIKKGDKVCYRKDIYIGREREPNSGKYDDEVAEVVVPEGHKEVAVKRLLEMAIFENDHCLVINKENGVPSQMGSGLDFEKTSDLSIDRMLRYYVEDGKLVHRLDMKTSGLMVLAKSKEMAIWLTSRFHDRDVHKAYYAVLCGVPHLESGIIR